jgi:hypothetical protein
MLCRDINARYYRFALKALPGVFDRLASSWVRVRSLNIHNHGAACQSLPTLSSDGGRCLAHHRYYHGPDACTSACTPIAEILARRRTRQVPSWTFVGGAGEMLHVRSIGNACTWWKTTCKQRVLDRWGNGPKGEEVRRRRDKIVFLSTADAEVF